MYNVYCSVISNFAGDTAPLNGRKEKGRPFEFKMNLIGYDAFQQQKERLTSPRSFATTSTRTAVHSKQIGKRLADRLWPFVARSERRYASRRILEQKLVRAGRQLLRSRIVMPCFGVHHSCTQNLNAWGSIYTLYGPSCAEWNLRLAETFESLAR